MKLEDCKNCPHHSGYSQDDPALLGTNINSVATYRTTIIHAVGCPKEK